MVRVEKTTWLQSPSIFLFGGGGGHQAPREPKSAKNYVFLQCFLVLHKSLKVASTPALKRPSCELFGALGPQKMHVTWLFTVFFCLQEGKACIFAWFWGHERATRDPKRNTKQHKTTFYLHFCRGFASWVQEWKDERVKGSWGERVLGGRVLGLWGIIKRGE